MVSIVIAFVVGVVVGVVALISILAVSARASEEDLGDD